MANYRDPKVTKASEKGGSSGKWIGVAVAVVVGLLLLAWLLGWFADETAEVGTLEPVAAEEPLVIEAPALDE